MRFPSFTIRGFKKPREVMGAVFGKLEAEVMRLVWQRGDIRVRDVYVAFEKRIAYTTLMTTLYRLYRKGVLDRRKSGRAFIYSARLSPLEFERSIARDLVEGMIDRASGGAEPLLACIVDAVSDQDRALLNSLDKMIKDKKRELKKGKESR